MGSVCLSGMEFRLGSTRLGRVNKGHFLCVIFRVVNTGSLMLADSTVLFGVSVRVPSSLWGSL